MHNQSNVKQRKCSTFFKPEGPFWYEARGLYFRFYVKKGLISCQNDTNAPGVGLESLQVCFTIWVVWSQWKFQPILYFLWVLLRIFTLCQFCSLYSSSNNRALWFCILFGVGIYLHQEFLAQQNPSQQTTNYTYQDHNSTTSYTIANSSKTLIGLQSVLQDSIGHQNTQIIHAYCPNNNSSWPGI